LRKGFPANRISILWWHGGNSRRARRRRLTH